MLTLFFLYLIKVSVCLTGLVLLYYLLFRGHTFHHVNRFCILFIIAISFIIPSVPVSVPHVPVVPLLSETWDYNDAPTTATDGNQMEHSGSWIALSSLAGGGYFLVAALLLFRFLRSLVVLYQIERKSTLEFVGRIRVKRTELGNSFTFMNTIFIPGTQRDEIVLRHEEVHVLQRHWIDLFIAEAASIALWFNPIVHLLKLELRLQHEFLADRSVISGGVSFEDYAQCLVKHMTSGGSVCNIASPLFSNSSKKRILMMTKKKTSPYKLMAYLLMLPACAIALMSMGSKQAPVNSTVQEISSDIPDIFPVDFTRVARVVPFGQAADRRTGKMRRHTGIDFDLSAGSEVIATADGVVVVQAFGQMRGNHVVIRHNEKVTTQYFHLQSAAVTEGERVKKGQTIGLVGNTGLSAAPHLHYEVLHNYKAVDPKDYLPRFPDEAR